ncbi:MAG: DUF411 domain-containing protein, partial [Pseudomonadota bacterium]|nr:DUF411 domain-containing protein [Pseudomonadota bacterium]
MLMKLLNIAFFGLVLGAAPLAAAEPSATAVEMWRNAGCGCCGKWASHLEANGFKVTIREPGSEKLQQIKKLAGIAEKLESCHTAKIGG